ncbi:oligoendopeptidase F [Alkalithermobacter thermoalcaliphilus JW-YL-7 = DSM 7308]|uniref:Oligopeptidase F n=1 Tax=Alkalithermobacter thermoalcaliphilus JW-YL-7 = DSM 7308 TaxID=1121328 RepID=A0A150FRS0_CLOPD|nr:oligoendopeptidase F [[Clostridium] paradoxum JW-YL-7 = DSM 7308]SHK38248.1 oligoendopeptidase F [[Clostridium] paradoxum JW-YL-7 = DSM 7308]
MGKKRSEINKEYKWDLDSMYKDDEHLKKDFDKVRDMLKNLKQYKGKLKCSKENLYNALSVYEDILRLSQHIYVYTHMKQHEDNTDTKNQALAGKAEMLSTEVSTETSFIVPEIIKISDEIINDYMKCDKLKKYDKFIEEILRKKPYTLSEREEEILSSSLDVSNTIETTFEMLSFADMKFPEIEDENRKKVQITHANYSTFMQSKNRDVRKKAFESMYETYKKYKNTFASTLSGAIKREVFYSKIRGYKSALEASLFQDNITTLVYENLIDAVNENLNLLHEYLRLKKEFLNLDNLHMYDLYVPLVENFDMKITYEQAKQILLEAFKPLGDEYISLVKKCFDERWIDVYENEGKKSGAYSWGSYDSYPFILMNYKDDLSSLFTVAHEIGHSIHSYYSKKNQPFIYSRYKIFVAEVASTLNEQLLMDYMLKNATTKEEKLYLLNYYLEQFRTTVYRQTMFAEFEKITHEKIENKQSLTSEQFCQIYYDLNLKYHGKDMIVDENIQFEWARVPHFYSNFYVYKYATGFSAASFLSFKILNNEEKAVEKYIEFLKSGGSDYPLNQLKKAGVDMEDKNSIYTSLKVFADLIEKLRKEK